MKKRSTTPVTVSTKRIKITELSKTVASILQDYSDELVDATKTAVDEIAPKVRKVVKDNAPPDDDSRGRQGKDKYKNNIKQKVTSETITSKTRTVYADNGQYRLTHLLEYGHAKVNGAGRTRAFPHWSKGEELAQEELPNLIEKNIKKIGGGG